MVSFHMNPYCFGYVALGHVEAVALHVEHERGEGDEGRRKEEEAPPVHHVHVQRHARAEASHIGGGGGQPARCRVGRVSLSQRLGGR